MARNYSVRFGVVKNLHEILLGVQGKIEARVKVKKVIKKLRGMPDHGIDPLMRQHFWGTDFDNPVHGPDGRLMRYEFIPGCDRETTRFLKLSPNLVETVIWEMALKPILERANCTPSLDEQIEEICEDFRLMDAFNRLLPEDDEDEEEDEEKVEEAKTTEEETDGAEGADVPAHAGATAGDPG